MSVLRRVPVVVFWGSLVEESFSGGLSVGLFWAKVGGEDVREDERRWSSL